MKKNGIVVVGSANMDMVMTVERYPHPGETVFGETFGMFPGGKGANQAVAVAKLGGHVTFIGKMGKDIFAEKLSCSMRKDGVNLDYLHIDNEAPTGTAMIMVNQDGQNEIVVISGSNMKLTPLDIDNNRKVFSSAKITLLQLEIPLSTVLRSAQIAKANGQRVILNPAPAQRLPKSLLKLIDIITPNETEAEILTGIRVNNNHSAVQAAKKLLSMGVRVVIITLGKNGALLVDEGREKFFPTLRVKSIDSTGAGDAFNGGLAFSLANDNELDDAIIFACAVAAFSVTKMGAQDSMPSMKELKGFLSNRRSK